MGGVGDLAAAAWSALALPMSLAGGLVAPGAGVDLERVPVLGEAIDQEDDLEVATRETALPGEVPLALVDRWVPEA